jgi:ketosteroid isomerase-like protein
MPRDVPPASIRSAELALREAQLASDVTALETLLDDALVFTGPDGAIYGKHDDLDAHRSGSIRITQLDASDEHVQDFGSIVVVTVRMDMRGSFKGVPFEGPVRYTRVWRAGADGWRVVAGHVSAVATS